MQDGRKTHNCRPLPLKAAGSEGLLPPRQAQRLTRFNVGSILPPPPPLPLAQCDSQGFCSATLQSALFITLFKKNKKNKKVNKMITIQSSNSHLGSRNMLQYKTAANMTTTPQNKPARVGSSHSVGRTIHFRGGEACQCY